MRSRNKGGSQKPARPKAILLGRDNERKAAPRELVWGLAEHDAFGKGLSVTRRRIEEKYFPRLSKKTMAFVENEVPGIVADFKARRIGVEEAIASMHFDVDSFIVRNLPIGRLEKEKARQVLVHEALLTQYLSMAHYREQRPKEKVLALYRKCMGNWQALPQSQKQRLLKISPGFELRLGEAIKQLEASKSNAARVSQEFIAELKLSNSLSLRSVIGDEMTDLYAKTYASVKHRIFELGML